MAGEPSTPRRAEPRAFLAVDWSGARSGVKRKLWIAEADEGGLVRLECGRTREELVAHLVELARAEPALVVGLDFAFSFPAWFLEREGLADARSFWRLVARDGEGWLARSPHPFWGRPGRRRPPADPACNPWRACERARLPVAGILPKSVFQTGGAGAVGTGSLRGMPHLATLQDAGFAVWPFDRARLPLVLEIYPRWLTGAVAKSSRAARACHLAARHADVPRALLALAEGSEDAFDAAVSAIAMRASARELAGLPDAADARERLEGRIWAPRRDPLFRGSG